MSKQRPAYSRRRFLQTAGAVGIAGVAGCTTNSASSESPTVALLGPGSFQHALTNGLEPGVDVPVQVETHGSATVARLIADGQRDPDIVSVADIALFEDPLSPPWHSVFASNSVVLIYNPDSEGGQRVADAGPERWYEPLVDGAADIGRTDPDQDPLGYRTRFTVELASRYYDGASNLADRILRPDQRYPETALLSQFETGAIDVAFAYRNMAIERGYDYVELPDQINLSNPAYTADWYSTTSYRLPSGQEIRGDLISYGATIRHMSDAAIAVFDALTTGQYLPEYGFLLRDQFPTYSGAVPDGVRHATTDSMRRQSPDRQSRLDPDGELSATPSDITVLR